MQILAFLYNYSAIVSIDNNRIFMYTIRKY